MDVHANAVTGSKLNIRLANSESDLDYLLPVSLELHNSSRFRDIEYSREKRDRLFMKAIENPNASALFVAEIDDIPVGFLFCGIGEYIVGTGQLFTSVHSFYVRESYRHALIGGRAAVRLLASVVNWSQARGAREVMIHVTSGIDIQRTDKFLRRANFNVIGANYALRLGRNGRESS
jgi:hypothetical protein